MHVVKNSDYIRVLKITYLPLPTPISPPQSQSPGQVCAFLREEPIQIQT